MYNCYNNTRNYAVTGRILVNSSCTRIVIPNNKNLILQKHQCQIYIGINTNKTLI